MHHHHLTRDRRTDRAFGGAKTACTSTCAACDEPLTAILARLESGQASSAVIGHFDGEPILLYPQLEERGWRHEAIDEQCGDCEGGFMLRMVRWGR